MSLLRSEELNSCPKDSSHSVVAKDLSKATSKGKRKKVKEKLKTRPSWWGELEFFRDEISVWLKSKTTQSMNSVKVESQILVETAEESLVGAACDAERSITAQRNQTPARSRSRKRWRFKKKPRNPKIISSPNPSVVSSCKRLKNAEVSAFLVG